MEGVFGTPTTGTADAFWEALGILLLCLGAVMMGAIHFEVKTSERRHV